MNKKFKELPEKYNLIHYRLGDNYLYNNEIYFTDIYTELGLNYNPSPEILANIRDYYVKIYFRES